MCAATFRTVRYLLYVSLQPDCRVPRARFLSHHSARRNLSLAINTFLFARQWTLKYAEYVIRGALAVDRSKNAWIYCFLWGRELSNLHSALLISSRPCVDSTRTRTRSPQKREGVLKSLKIEVHDSTAQFTLLNFIEIYIKSIFPSNALSLD